jgi:catechol 2,3-dioxygenase-like lactoylglutathione lyase family enzyme
MTALRHVGIVVRNLDAALGFYRDLLGFREVRAMDESGEFLDSILGLSHAKVRTVKLAGTSGGQVELLAFQDPKAQVGPPPPLTRAGPTHIAVTVSDVDGLYARLRQSGVECTTPPRVSPDGGAKVTFCRDPDGTYVELVQVLRP